MKRDHLHDTLPDQPAEEVDDVDMQTPPRGVSRNVAAPVTAPPVAAPTPAGVDPRTARILEALDRPPRPPTPTPEERASSDGGDFVAYSSAAIPPPPSSPGRGSAVGPSDAPVAIGDVDVERWVTTEPRRGGAKSSHPWRGRWKFGFFIAGVAAAMGFVLRITMSDGASVTTPVATSWTAQAGDVPAVEAHTERLAPLAEPLLPPVAPAETLAPLPTASASSQVPSWRRPPVTAVPASATATSWTPAPASAPAAPLAPMAAPTPRVTAAHPPAIPATAPSGTTDKLIEHPW